MNRCSNFSSGKLVFVSILLITCLLISGCETGKNAYKQGHYTTATRKAAHRLANYPNSPNAEEVLLNAYPQARDYWLRQAKNAQANSSDPFHWELVVQSYETLHGLIDDINRTHLAGHAALNLKYHYSELDQARASAAAARKTAGDELLELNERFAAREAYHHYQKSLQYQPNQPDVLESEARARDIGTIVISIEVVSAQPHGLSPVALEDTLLDYLSDRPAHEFLSFIPRYSSIADNAHFDLQVSIQNSRIGNRSESCETKEHSKEIVDGKTDEDPPKNILKTVKAKVTRCEKEMKSFATAIVNLYNAESRNIDYTEQLHESVAWHHDWYELSGDKRAVPDKIKESNEPHYPSNAEQAEELIHSLSRQIEKKLYPLLQQT